MKTELILQQVKKTYSAIAKEFDATRNRPWPEFETLTKTIKRKKASSRLRLLDVGCGNGRLFHFLKNLPVTYVGVDNNQTILSIARKNAPESKFLYSEMTKLPFPAHTFDIVCCIAALHHLPTHQLQLKALKEMKRVCRKNGFCFITVWNLSQPKYKKFVQPETHHAWIPWGNKKMKRFYYAFTTQELKTLFQKAGFTKIKKNPSEHNLIFLIE